MAVDELQVRKREGGVGGASGGEGKGRGVGKRSCKGAGGRCAYWLPDKVIKEAPPSFPLGLHTNALSPTLLPAGIPCSNIPTCRPAPTPSPPRSACPSSRGASTSLPPASARSCTTSAVVWMSFHSSSSSSRRGWGAERAPKPPSLLPPQWPPPSRSWRCRWSRPSGGSSCWTAARRWSRCVWGRWKRPQWWFRSGWTLPLSRPMPRLPERLLSSQPPRR